MESHLSPKGLMVPFRADTPSRSKLDYWVAIERSVPGRMHLLPILDAQNKLIDFRCAVATSAVARLLDDLSGDAVGRQLSVLLSSQEDPIEVLLAYVSTAITGQSTRFVSNSRAGGQIQHTVRVLPRSVLDAEVRDVSAMGQARAAFDKLKSVPGT